MHRTEREREREGERERVGVTRLRGGKGESIHEESIVRHYALWLAEAKIV